MPEEREMPRRCESKAPPGARLGREPIKLEFIDRFDGIAYLHTQMEMFASMCLKVGIGKPYYT